MPLYSVIMPAFNAETTITESISSVLNQTSRDFALIIINDCSTDNTALIAENAARADKRISLLHTTHNSGSPSAPRSMGVNVSSSRYISFLDADDTWKPNKMDFQIDIMKRKGAAFSCTAYEVIDHNGRLVGSFTPPITAHYRTLLRHNTIGCLTAVYDTEKLGLHTFPDCGHEDYALWLEMTRNGLSIMGIRKNLACYRLSPNSVSRNKLKIISYYWNIYHVREGFSSLNSIYMCARYAILNYNKYYNHPHIS